MSKTEIQNRINIALKFLKETRGFNQNQIAKKLAVTPGTITRLGNGENALTESMALLLSIFWNFFKMADLWGRGNVIFSSKHWR
uniref:Transcriptional regulator n=1 Tax=Leptospira interrogans serovar Canicola TaxID=211880 RepID=A0A067YBY1_LEPIR|nr:transcriptional regulator [Leptospira interrogans serovar Canicola]